MGFAKYHEDDQRIFDDRMYYRYGSFSFGIQSDYSKPVKYESSVAWVGDSTPLITNNN